MTGSEGHFVHTTIAGDRWDLLAHVWYGDARKQTVLIEANRHLFTDPLTVPPAIMPAGLEIIIPVIDETAVDDSHLPPWKRNNPDYGGS